MSGCTLCGGPAVLRVVYRGREARSCEVCLSNLQFTWALADLGIPLAAVTPEESALMAEAREEVGP